MTKKQHYMKTLAGRRHLKKMQAGKRRAQTAKRKTALAHEAFLKYHKSRLGVQNEKQSSNSPDTEGATHRQISYAFGRIERELEVISRSSGLSFSALAAGVGELLRRQER